MSLWGGRFAGKTDPAFDSFNRSLPFDGRLLREDLEGSRAWARALARAGVLRASEAKSLVAALNRVEKRLTRDRRPLTRSKAEDVHSFVEDELVEDCGALGKKLHAGRSRNDQVATDLRLWCIRKGAGLDAELVSLMRALAELAQREAATPVPGYTHLQRAQVVTIGHHVLAYVEMLARDRSRLADCTARLDACPLGSGALAGTGFDVDRKELAAELGFERPTRNSLDAVSDRDFVAELCFVATLSAAHLSRLAEDWIFWASAEAGFVELSDAVTTGSSLMPQKKNPDSLELVRGKGARVLGRLTGFLACLRSLPLAYDKDLQEDKEALFDALDTWEACLVVTRLVAQSLEVDSERCVEACLSGHMGATDLADWLVARGVVFRDAHARVGKLVRRATADGRELHELDLATLRKILPEADASALASLDPVAALTRRSALGSANPRLVAREARRWLRALG